MFARIGLVASSYPIPAYCLTALAILMGAEARAQVLPKTPPDLGTATTALPPGPAVTDWQPRGGAPIGTKIVHRTPRHQDARARSSDLRGTGGLVPALRRLRVAAWHHPDRANGSSLPLLQLSLPLSIPAPTRYAFETTGQLTAKLAAALVRAGLGSVCEGSTSNGATGVTTVGSDLQILIRGGALDVSCTFRTAQTTLGEGVRLVEMRWVSNKVGDRCGKAGTITSTLPSVSFQFTRGSVVVNPDANQPARDFFAFGDGAIVVDGVTLMTVTRPTSVLLPMILDVQCAPMTLPLQTSTGTSLPTTSPSVIRRDSGSHHFRGPAGLTLNDLLRGG